MIEEFVRRFGGFDMVVGGSPWNNIAERTCHSCNGFEGEHLSLFYEYVQIFDDVRSTMWRIVKHCLLYCFLLRYQNGRILSFVVLQNYC
jgi:hypothetical protein